MADSFAPADPSAQTHFERELAAPSPVPGGPAVGLQTYVAVYTTKGEPDPANPVDTGYIAHLQINEVTIQKPLVVMRALLDALREVVL